MKVVPAYGTQAANRMERKEKCWGFENEISQPGRSGTRRGGYKYTRRIGSCQFNLNPIIQSLCGERSVVCSGTCWRGVVEVNFFPILINIFFQKEEEIKGFEFNYLI